MGRHNKNCLQVCFLWFDWVQELQQYWELGSKAAFLCERCIANQVYYCSKLILPGSRLANLFLTNAGNWQPVNRGNISNTSPQMPSNWLFSQPRGAANPQGSAYFHSPLHHFKFDPLSLDSKHVLVSGLGFGPPQSNTIPLLLVFCPNGRQE